MADIVDKLSVRFWNGSFYAAVVFPDGTRQELKSDTDLTFAGWQGKIATAWEAIQNPPAPVEEVDLIAATTEELKAEIAKRGLTAEDLGLTDTKPVEEVIK